MRVLVVDDDPFANMVVSSLVSAQEGYHTSTADSGAGCLAQLGQEAFAESPCDVVLLDYELGDMTALSVVQTIRGCDATGAPMYPWLDGVRIIILSGHDENGGYQHDLRALGIDTFWSKPVGVQQIRDLRQ